MFGFAYTDFESIKEVMEQWWQRHDLPGLLATLDDFGLKQTEKCAALVPEAGHLRKRCLSWTASVTLFKISPHFKSFIDVQFLAEHETLTYFSRPLALRPCRISEHGSWHFHFPVTGRTRSAVMAMTRIMTWSRIWRSSSRQNWTSHRGRMPSNKSTCCRLLSDFSTLCRGSGIACKIL